MNNKNRVYIKSKNNVSKIKLRYTISLIFIFITTIIINLFLNNIDDVINLAKSLIISLIIASITTYIINVIKKEYKLTAIYKDDHIEQIAIIISLFSINSNVYIISLATVASIIIKKLVKNIDISAALYGIFIILLLNNSSIKELQLSNINEVITLEKNIIYYLFSIEYIAPALSIISFCYLIHKKSIKYYVVFPYFITYFLLMLLYGLLNNFNLLIALIELLKGGLLFLITYTLTDYKITPMTNEGNIIYGIILAILTVILKFIIPSFSVIIPLIIGPIILTKTIDKMSLKLKYNHKFYYITIITTIIIGMAIIIPLTLNMSK